MLNCRIKAIPIATDAPSIKKFLEKRPHLKRLGGVKVVLLYNEYCIDNHNELAADQPSLDIWEL